MDISKKLNINWLDCTDKLTIENIKDMLSQVKVILPQSYIDLIREHNGGTPSKPCFEYVDIDGKTWINGIGNFLSWFAHDEYDDFLRTFLSPPEFFPMGLIAFADTGEGDFICFDYRQGKDNIDPQIVYWSHEAEVGKDVSFVASNFEEFLGMLKEPDDLD